MKTAEQRRNRRTAWVALALALCCLLIALLLRRGCEPESQLRKASEGSGTGTGGQTSAAPAPAADTAVHAGPAVPDTVTAPKPLRQKPVVRRKVLLADSSAGRSLPSGADTLEEQAPRTAQDSCLRDTIAPYVYPDPSGGMHRSTVNVRLVANKPCSVDVKIGDAGEWRSYAGENIPVETTLTLFYRAADHCGKEMPVGAEYYEIVRSADAKRCPRDMEFVGVSGTELCIDRYEWPNKKGKRPGTYVSLYHATDSCYSAGKRLCTEDEWKIACSGPYGWRYPYGKAYEYRACVTQDTSAHASGSMPECRGYFDVYDMSGNVLEWTSTRSSQNSMFYDVMGGFWESGSHSACYDVRYSYYPQNRHNPVGFRCCKDPDKKI